MSKCRIFYNIISDGQSSAFEVCGDFLRRDNAYNVVFYTVGEGKRTRNSYAIFPAKVVFSRSGDTSYSVTLKKGETAEGVMKTAEAELPFSAKLKNCAYEYGGGEFSFDISYDITFSTLTLNNRVCVKAVIL